MASLSSLSCVAPTVGVTQEPLPFASEVSTLPAACVPSFIAIEPFINTSSVLKSPPISGVALSLFSI